MRAAAPFDTVRLPSRSNMAPVLRWGAALALAGICLLVSAQARASSMTDIVTVTAGGTTGAGGAGFKAGGFGSVKPAVTANGYTYEDIYNAGGINNGKGSTAPYSEIAIGGFTSNPGQSWLTSVSALGVTTSGSSATYTYSDGVATWVWQGTEWGIDNTGTVQVSVTHGAPALGYLDLKFQVVGVDYAPPGASSFVEYTNASVRGTAASNSQSFTNTTTVTDTGDIGVDIFSLVAGDLTDTASYSYSQTDGNNSSFTVDNTTTNTDKIPGPANSALGVDHAYDIIWVWLNPVADEYVGGNAVSFAGYSYNGEDDADGAEIVPLYVSWLQNPATMPADVAARLARSWDTSGLGGLTAADYTAILAMDPFSSSSYNPYDDTSGRFQAVSGTTVPYVPAASGAQPVTVTGTFATQSTTATGKTAETSYSVGVTLLFSSSIDFIADLGEKLSIADTFKITDSWSSTNNSAVGNTAEYSITGPASTAGYTGPVSFQVFRDNVYGSFMFYPVE
jgi:hypothetical protein